MRIEEDVKLDFCDVLIKPKSTELNSRADVFLEVSYDTKYSKKKLKGVPVLVSNMAKIGCFNMAKSLHEYKIGVCLHKHHELQFMIDFCNNPISEFSFLTFGINDLDMQKLSLIKDQGVSLHKICLDVANGYMYSFLDKIKIIREWFPESILMAGNVCTPEGVENIVKSGADIVKCGIGQGSKCETKNKAGVSYKQFSCAMECGQAAIELGALCCSDGGIKTPADICKALGAGSHLVMCGGIFFGYEQNETEWVEENSNKKMLSYGMSSRKANEEFFGGLKEYRTSEGKEEWVEYKGDVSDLAKDIRGSIASACTYTNTAKIENFSENCVFTKI